MGSGTAAERARLAPVLRTGGFALACAALVLLGRATRVDGTQLALVWPAAGLAFVWLLSAWGHPARLRADVVVLALVTGGGNLLTGAGPGLAAVLGVANAAQALVACVLFTRLQPGRELHDLRGFGALVAASFGGALGGAAVGLLAEAAGVADVPTAPLLWTLRNGAGTLVIAAVVLSFVGHARAERAVPRERRLELALSAVLAAAVYALVFVALDDVPLTFVVLPTMAWVAVRYPTPVAAVANLAGACIAVAGTLDGHGPFATQAVEPRVAMVQAFIGVASVLVLLVAIHRDEHGRLLARLDRSDRRQRMITDGSGLVLFEVDAEHRWSHLSSGWTALTGLDVEASLGSPSQELPVAEDLPRVAAAARRLAEGEVDQLVVEHRFTHPQRGERWVQLHAHLIAEPGEPPRIAGTLRDVTDQKTAELELAAERSFTAALLDALDTGIVACDADGKLRLFNDATRRMHGLPAVPVAQDQWAERFSLFRADGTTPLPPAEVPLARAFEGETVENSEMVIAPRRGTPVTVSASGRTIRDADGRRLGAVVAMHDVTARRAAEDALRAQADDLANVATVAHALAAQTGVDEVRETICDAVRRTAGSSTVILFEPDGDRLVATAMAGDGDILGEDRLTLPFDGESGSVIAFRTSEPYFAPDTGAAPVSREAVRRIGTRSVLCHPVVREGRPVGVLAAGWSTPVTAVPDRVMQVIELLAAEAAIAIERAGLVDELTTSAHTDSLTGVANRRSWDDRLPRILDRAQRSEEPLCVAMLDLDHFKAFNDARGHQDGDALLRETARAWESEIRSSDLLARYGGEEFALALPACGPDHALRLAERLRGLVPQGQTCSIGIAHWDGSEPGETLIARADAALYDAKARGRDQTVLAGGEAASPTSLVLRMARQALGMDVAFLAGISDDEFSIRQITGDAAAFGVDGDVTMPLADTYCARMLDGRVDGIVADTRAHPETARLEITQAAGVGAYIGAPVRGRDGRVLGTLCGLSRSPAAHLADEHLELLQRLAGAVAPELEADGGDDGRAPAGDPEALAASWDRIAGGAGPAA